MTNMSKINMTALRQVTMPATGLHIADRPAERSADKSGTTDPWKLRKTLYEVQVGWSEMRDAPRSRIRNGFRQMIELCQKSGKPEALVENIAPSFKVGRDDPNLVLGIHDEIVEIFMEAVVQKGCDVPECRLGLRRGEFDIRFYLGRTRPTDYEVEDLDY